MNVVIVFSHSALHDLGIFGSGVETEKEIQMLRILVTASFILASTFVTSATVTSIASAGEGHWSIGHGVQCRLINGVVVCSSARP